MRSVKLTTAEWREEKEDNTEGNGAPERNSPSDDHGDGWVRPDEMDCCGNRFGKGSCHGAVIHPFVFVDTEELRSRFELAKSILFMPRFDFDIEEVQDIIRFDKNNKAMITKEYFRFPGSLCQDLLSDSFNLFEKEEGFYYAVDFAEMSTRIIFHEANSPEKPNQ